MGFWCFLLLLGINALYPSILILLPDWRLARLAAASMDAVLDLGYTLTYIAIVLAALPALSSQTSVFGNFGDEDLMISNELTPAFAFPSDALGFAAVYVSLAHVLAVCRALERGEDGLANHRAGKREGRANLGNRGFKRLRTFFISGLYSSLLFLVIFWNLYGASYPWQQKMTSDAFLAAANLWQIMGYAWSVATFPTLFATSSSASGIPTLRRSLLVLCPRT